jgi:type II secretory ATPase GspE/PulE/Tfp pilus assembly ATPase PilB-like protein
MFALASARKASDIHIEPLADRYEVRFRVDGLLTPVQRLDLPAGRALATRLMVMANLLTYRLDIPQEGRIAGSAVGGADVRLSIMPTTHGIRAAVRMPAELQQSLRLDELDLPAETLAGLKRFAAGDSGMLLLTGPAGSGKTTTIYALLDYIASRYQGLSILSVEDPVERDLPGVTQIEVSPFGELTYERALRSILRQDPQVLMLGEIRDAATASLAVQVALSGHRLISTMHAGTPGAALARLIEMGIEPYQVTSAVFGIVSQRLLRRRAGDGYAGRVPVAEYVPMDEPLRMALLKQADATQLQALASQHPGHVSLRQAAGRLIETGLTDTAEARRLLGEENI